MLTIVVTSADRRYIMNCSHFCFCVFCFAKVKKKKTFQKANRGICTPLEQVSSLNKNFSTASSDNLEDFLTDLGALVVINVTENGV